MARKDNRIATKQLTITLAWPLLGYLDRMIPLGFYGATFTSAAEKAIEKHAEFLIAHQKIQEMTAQELANPPLDYLQKPRRPRRKKSAE